MLVLAIRKPVDDSKTRQRKYDAAEAWKWMPHARSIAFVLCYIGHMKKKFGYYKRGGGITPRPELIREFEADAMKHEKEYVTFIKYEGTSQQPVGAISLNKGEWVEEIKQ